MYRRYIKRLLDILISFLGLIILSPFLITISILLYFSIGRPIFFVQERIGKDEKAFNLIKFRTMTNQRDENNNLLPEEKRVTKVGKILRKTSLDELPELLCVLTGKMSIIGPRPLPTYYGPYFFEEERKRHNVRGGLIPPDSLSEKTYTTFEEQFEYECYYAENISFVLDCKVFWKTVKILFGRVQTDYGSELDRPHLNIYRSFMDEEKVSVFETEEKSIL